MLLTVFPMQFSQGDTVNIALTNGSPQTMHYGNPVCALRLEQADAGKWNSTTAVNPDGVGCDAIAIALAPDDFVNLYRFPLGELPPGEYRFKLGTTWGGAGLTLISNIFAIDAN